MTSILISADDIKKDLPGYSPERSEEFHSESAKLADAKLYETIKTSKFEKVVLLSGGPASGKTEYFSEYLDKQDLIVLDGILPTEKGAGIKIGRISKSKKKIEIHAVWPQDFKQAFVAFLNRDRKFSDRYFYEKHSSARKTLLWIAENYPHVEIKLIKNAYLGEDLSFTELKFETRGDLLAYLRENQYTKDDIIKLVSE
ncbi:MAG: hypothetical protein HYV13_00700 [Candidatus Doudnabacteria bacterium]|nr:hypothetical protein [Candidatus Doudnabacteria bacterium]